MIKNSDYSYNGEKTKSLIHELDIKVSEFNRSQVAIIETLDELTKFVSFYRNCFNSSAIYDLCNRVTESYCYLYDETVRSSIAYNLFISVCNDVINISKKCEEEMK